MATVIQALPFTNAVTGTTHTSTVSATVPGRPLIVLLSLITKTTTPTSITDSAANAGWVQIVGGGSSTAGSCFIWWNPNPAASITTFTTNYSATTKSQVSFFEVAGLSGQLGTGAATTPNTVAGTSVPQAITTSSPCFIISGIGAVPAATVAAPFALTAASGGGAGLQLTTATSEQPLPGTYTSTWTITSAVSTTSIAAFRLALPRPPRPATVVAMSRRRRPTPTRGVIIGGRQQLAVSQAAPVIIPPRQYVFDPVRTPRGQRRGSTIAPYLSQRGAASLILEALVTPPPAHIVLAHSVRPGRARGVVLAPRPVLSAAPTPRAVVVQQARPGRTVHHTAIVQTRPIFAIQAAPANVPPRPTLVQTHTPRQDRHAQIIAPNAAQVGAASLILEALVTPPRTTVIQTRPRVPQRHGSVNIGRTIVVPTGTVTVTPPKSTLIQARASKRNRPGVVLAPRPVFVPPPFTVPPRPTVILTHTPPAHRHGLVIETRWPAYTIFTAPPVGQPRQTVWVILARNTRPERKGAVIVQQGKNVVGGFPDYRAAGFGQSAQPLLKRDDFDNFIRR